MSILNAIGSIFLSYFLVKNMRKIPGKIENWLWIVALIGALVYFHWLLGGFHSENEKLKESQDQFSEEIEEKYKDSKQLQIEIQAQLKEVSKDLLKFLDSDLLESRLNR